MKKYSISLIKRNRGSLTPDRWLIGAQIIQLEEFRFLLNYRFDSMSPMAVVLVGQTELWDNKLKLQRYAAIRQRIDMYCILPHLDRSETEQYIASHKDYSKCVQEVFTAKALDEIHKASAGIPRMVNQVCEKALMYVAFCFLFQYIHSPYCGKINIGFFNSVAITGAYLDIP